MVLVTTACGSNSHGGGGNAGTAGDGGGSGGTGTGGYSATGGYGGTGGSAATGGSGGSGGTGATAGTGGNSGTAGTDGGAGTAGTDGGAGTAGTDGGAGTSGAGGGDAGTDAPTCTDACTLGATQCSGNGVQTCAVQSNGCTDWNAAQACASGETCQSGQCVTACTNNCTSGITQCIGTQIQTCAVQSNGCTDWNAAQDCPSGQTCNGGQCVTTCTNNCTSGNTQCSGTQIQTCATQSNGCTDWGAATDCAAGSACSGGACMCTNVCTLGATQCSGAQVETCVAGPSGCPVWGPAQDCSGTDTCQGSACACNDQCAGGATQCSGTQVETCTTQSNGCLDWSAPADCSGTDTCQGSACACNDQCTLGAKQCSGTQIQTCQTQSSGCTDWSTPADCPPSYSCSGGACTDIPCTPGAVRCSGNDVQECNNAGTAWLEVEACPGTCSAGACTGACTPGDQRCNGNDLEQCQSDGSTWTGIQTCSDVCSDQYKACAFSSLDITSDQSLDGDVYVVGAVKVWPNVTVTSPTGTLNIHAGSILVDCGASIVISPTGQTAAGRGHDGASVSSDPAMYGGPGGGGGGGHITAGQAGTNGAYYPGGNGGSTYGIMNANVQPGALGGNGGNGTPVNACTTGAAGGHGGGTLRLYAATSISVCGSLRANGEQGRTWVFQGGCSYWHSGGGGGGSGGGILLAADTIDISGTVSVAGGGGGYGASSDSTKAGNGGVGGQGRIKILHGLTAPTLTGTLTGQVVNAYLPPLTITSTTQPDPSLTYNDGFTQAAFAWNQPWSPIAGYYYLVNTNAGTVPTSGNATFTATESTTVPSSAFVNGTNYFHIVPVDSSYALGTVMNDMIVRINTKAPTVSSSTNPSQTTWVANSNPYFSWTFPVPDASVLGAYYVFDQYANTIPTTSDTFVPVTQKQVLISNVADGVHYFHVLSEDTRGDLTKAAAHYQIRVGTDPGTGTLLGQVTNGSGTGISGASVVLNGGFDSQNTDSNGNYNFQTEVVGTWQVTVSKTGYQDDVATVTVNQGSATIHNVTLSP